MAAVAPRRMSLSETLAALDGGAVTAGSGSSAGSEPSSGSESGPLVYPVDEFSSTVVFSYPACSAAQVYLEVNWLTGRVNWPWGLMDRTDTGEWLAGFHVPAEWRGSYSFIELDEVPQHAEQLAGNRSWMMSVAAKAVADPDNHRSYSARLGGFRSEAAGHRGNLAPLPQPGTLAGELSNFLWMPASSDFENRDCWLYTPHRSVQPGASLPLVVLFDGQVWAESIRLNESLDEWIASGVLPPVCVLMVDSLQVPVRSVELPRSARFIDQVADSLLPKTRAKCADLTGFEPDRTVVAGQSFGGLAALFAVQHRPEVFSAALSQSGSFWWPEFGSTAAGASLEELDPAALSGKRLVLHYGSLETFLAESNQVLGAALQDAEVHAQITEVCGGHDWAWWHAELGNGIAAVLAR